MPKTILAADLFCGAGGTSSGLSLAVTELGASLDLVAVNHWPTAIATHSANHPAARHLCNDLDAVNPREAVPGGRLDLLVASPECTHHSRARGGRPVSDQRRSSAWHVLRWSEALYITAIIIENVPEWQEWGPLGADGCPLASKKGETYRAFLASLKSLGYKVEDRVLNAADYGDPTTRERLFVMARRDGRRVVWPEPTHAEKPGLFGEKKWRGAREVIDFKIKSRSIFSRKKPLAPATMRRIIAGLRRHNGPHLEPFLVQLTHHGNDENRAMSIDKPLPTVTTAHRGEVGLIQPFILSQASGGAPRLVDQPVPTIPTDGAHALVQAAIVTLRNHDAGRSINQPVPTLTAGGTHVGLVEPYLVEPQIVNYYGTGITHPVSEPLPTVSTKDRFGLVIPVHDGMGLDIHFRMLQPKELAGAMGFPPDYQFTGNRGDQVKQIGNAVAVNTARALCRAALRVNG